MFSGPIVKFHCNPPYTFQIQCTIILDSKMPEFTKVDCEPTDGSNDLCLLVNFQPWTAKGVKDVILLKSLDVDIIIQYRIPCIQNQAKIILNYNQKL